MRARAALAAALALAALTAGCGDEDESLPVACRQADAAAVQRALQGVPQAHAEVEGTRLSECVRLAKSGGDLQSVGSAYTQAADALALAAARSDADAFRLGYLIGATRRGAERTNGVALELAFRVRQAAGVSGPPPARRAAFRSGVAAGRADG